MGKFGLGVLNKNGLLFTDFCQENGLVLGDTLFQHMPLHMYMWQYPNGLVRNQIYHIATESG